MVDNLDLFLNPKSIAIIGASEFKEKVGGILLSRALKSKAKIIPINPNHNKLLGLNCYKSVLDYDKKIDLAIIAIPAPFVASSLEECGKKKIKNVIIISAGFSEIGNLAGEEQLIQIANKYKIRILGPNCFGVCNPSKNFDFTFSALTANSGNIAFISQSGALWSYAADFSIGKFGFSGVVCLGNMSDLEFCDFIEYFSKDKKTKSLILYIEKLKDGKRFIDICKKVKKKIYAVKVGSSKEGEKAAFSHTASLASDYEIYRGAFKQAGVELCSSLLSAFEKASSKNFKQKRDIHEIKKLGDSSFIITNAGGAGGMISDYFSSMNIRLVESKEKEIKNPYDIIGTALSKDYLNALEKIKDWGTDFISVILTPQSMSEIEKTAEAIADFKKKTGKKVVAFFLGDKSILKANKIFEEAGILVFNTI